MSRVFLVVYKGSRGWREHVERSTLLKAMETAERMSADHPDVYVLMSEDGQPTVKVWP